MLCVYCRLVRTKHWLKPTCAPIRPTEWPRWTGTAPMGFPAPLCAQVWHHGRQFVLLSANFNIMANQFYLLFDFFSFKQRQPPERLKTSRLMEHGSITLQFTTLLIRWRGTVPTVSDFNWAAGGLSAELINWLLAKNFHSANYVLLSFSKVTQHVADWYTQDIASFQTRPLEKRCLALLPPPLEMSWPPTFNQRTRKWNLDMRIEASGLGCVFYTKVNAAVISGAESGWYNFDTIDINLILNMWVQNECRFYFKKINSQQLES